MAHEKRIKELKRRSPITIDDLNTLYASDYELIIRNKIPMTDEAVSTMRDTLITTQAPAELQSLFKKTYDKEAQEEASFDVDKEMEEVKKEVNKTSDKPKSWKEAWAKANTEEKEKFTYDGKEYETDNYHVGQYGAVKKRGKYDPNWLWSLKKGAAELQGAFSTPEAKEAVDNWVEGEIKPTVEFALKDAYPTAITTVAAPLTGLKAARAAKGPILDAGTKLFPNLHGIIQGAKVYAAGKAFDVGAEKVNERISDADGDGIPDYIDADPNTPHVEEEEAVQEEVVQEGVDDISDEEIVDPLTEEEKNEAAKKKEDELQARKDTYLDLVENYGYLGTWDDFLNMSDVDIEATKLKYTPPADASLDEPKEVEMRKPSLLDKIGGPMGIASLLVGKKYLGEAMKEIDFKKYPELSEQFEEYYQQQKDLSEEGFSAEEERKVRKDIDGAYAMGIDNMVRGTAGDRAKFLAGTGVLDARRSSALIDFAAKDAELRRQNQKGFVDLLKFKETHNVNKGLAERNEDMKMKLAKRTAQSELASSAFSSLIDSIQQQKLYGAGSAYDNMMRAKMSEMNINPVEAPSNLGILGDMLGIDSLFGEKSSILGNIFGKKDETTE